jgi:gamma-glutamylputrescine oxidase
MMINNLLKYDVCILGAGITGLTCAIELLQKGYKVVILEKEQMPSNSSNNNAGQIVPGFALDEISLARLYNQLDSQFLWNLTYEGIEYIKNNILSHQYSSCLTSNIYLYVTSLDYYNQLLMRWKKYRESYAPDNKMQYYLSSDVKSLFKSDYFIGGLKESNSYVLDPVSYINDLLRHVKKLGGDIKHSCPNLSLSYLQRNSNNIKIRISHHKSILARHLIVATNGQLNYGSSLNLFNGYLFKTHPIKNINLMPNLSFSVMSSKNFLHYCRYLEDGSFLFCCKSLPFNYSSRELIKMFSHEILSIFPFLKGMSIRQFSSAKIAVTKNKMPELGKISENIYYAQGYSGRGLVLGTLAGKIISEAICGDSVKLNYFMNLNKERLDSDERLLFAR